MDTRPGARVKRESWYQAGTMKLVTFEAMGEERGGILVGGDVIDLAAALAWHEKDHGRASSPEHVAERYGRGVLGLIEHGKEARRAADAVVERFQAGALPLQMDEMKLSLGPAKGKDFATGLGPYIVTVDELEHRARKTERGTTWDLEMRAFVNGVQVSTGNVKDMTWTFAQILERASY